MLVHRINIKCLLLIAAVLAVELRPLPTGRIVGVAICIKIGRIIAKNKREKQPKVRPQSRGLNEKTSLLMA